MDIPSREQLIRGCEEFEKHEKRDAMYKVALFLYFIFGVDLQIWQMD
jgi:hypothetical protein